MEYSSSYPKSYIKSIDAIRTISILAVVLIHTTTRILEVSGYKLNIFAWTLFFNQLARFAVPLFFLISGFVLELNYDLNSNYFAYIKKRLGKIFIPYVFWSAIYYLFVYNQNHDNFFRVLLTGNASYQLYFIPALLIFYLIFPLLHKMYKLISTPVALIILGGFQLMLMYRDYFVHQFSFADPIRISLLGYFVFIIGMVVARNKDKILEVISKIKFWLVLVVGYLVYYVFNEGRNLYFKTYNIEAFYSQWRISVLVYTLCLAALLFCVFENPSYQSKIVAKMAKLSFFVFFIHIIVLEVIWSNFGKFISNNGLFDLLFFGVVSGVSFFVASIAHKIPNLNKLTG